MNREGQLCLEGCTLIMEHSCVHCRHADIQEEEEVEEFQLIEKLQQLGVNQGKYTKLILPRSRNRFLQSR